MSVVHFDFKGSFKVLSKPFRFYYTQCDFAENAGVIDEYSLVMGLDVSDGLRVGYLIFASTFGKDKFPLFLKEYQFKKLMTLVKENGTSPEYKIKNGEVSCSMRVWDQSIRTNDYPEEDFLKALKVKNIFLAKKFIK